MPSSRLALVLALVLTTPVAGQSPPHASQSDTEEPKTEAIPTPQSPQRKEKLPDRFVPTDKISPDSVISFPSDI